MLDNIKYVVDKSPLTFAMLPEILITKARILFKGKRDIDALATLLQLNQIKPEYAAAYAQLGDYYQKVGDNSSAIRYYEQGLINTDKKNADFFSFKIKKLDNNYKIPLASSTAKTDESVQSNLPAQVLQVDSGQSRPIQPLTTPTLATPASPTPPKANDQKPAAEEAIKPNPYCRFCP
jgi:tetratricopeptide (TPR) repeat protein